MPIDAHVSVPSLVAPVDDFPILLKLVGIRVAYNKSNLPFAIRFHDIPVASKIPLQAVNAAIKDNYVIKTLPEVTMDIPFAATAAKIPLLPVERGRRGRCS